MQRLEPGTDDGGGRAEQRRGHRPGTAMSRHWSFQGWGGGRTAAWKGKESPGRRGSGDQPLPVGVKARLWGQRVRIQSVGDGSHWVTLSLVLHSTVATGQQGRRAVVESVWHMLTEAHVGQELTSIRN